MRFFNVNYMLILKSSLGCPINQVDVQRGGTLRDGKEKW